MGELLAVMSAMMFAAANVMVKKGTVKSSQDNGAFLSLLLTAFISLLIFIASGWQGGWPVLNGKGIFWFVLAGVLTAFIGRTFLYSSIQYLGSIKASAIKRLNPFFTVLIGLLFLDEPVTWPLIVGMILIASGFFVLVQQSYRGAEGAAERQPKAAKRMTELLRSLANLGYVYGPVSALAYAVGYAARKKGLLEIPDPIFGTALGAAVGTVLFLLLAVFRETYRTAVKLTFTRFQPWLFGAGVATSAGQIFYFLALHQIPVSRVALINSIEVIFTMFLSAWIFKTQEEMTGTVILASLAAMFGAALIAYS
ncbi:hypothetical protein BSNK01_26860 [Bacillaceae bacterium]